VLSIYIAGMRFTGILLFAAFALALVAGVVCCADASDCDGSCPCVCCGHNGLYIDSSPGAYAAIDTAPVQAAVSPLLISLHASPDPPPPEV
jgi:hypothetical protein